MGDGFQIIVGSGACTHNRHIVRMGMSHWTTDTFAFQSCISNEYDSLVRRHLVDRTKPDEDYTSWCLSFVKRWAQYCPKVAPWTDKEVLLSRPQRMRAKYTTAFKTPLHKKHSLVRMFVKFEKMHDRTKPPRAIQHRHSAFTARFAKYILPIEKVMYSTSYNNHGFKMFAKGRNQFNRAWDLRKAYEHYPNPTIYLADHSKFDSSVQLEHLFITHLLYEQIVGPEVLQYCIKQYINKGWTLNGHQYKCEGRRMSGDADTGIGNSIINYFTLKYMFGEDSIVYCDGDDSVVFTPEEVIPRTGTGFNTVMNTVDRFEDIDFCQCKPMKTDEGKWIMAREPLRAMSRMLVKCGAFLNENYVYSVGYGEALTSPQVPMLQDVAGLFMQADGKYNINFLEYQTKVGKVTSTIQPPTTTSMISYAEAHGYTPTEIKCLVDSIKLNPQIRLKGGGGGSIVLYRDMASLQVAKALPKGQYIAVKGKQQANKPKGKKSRKGMAQVAHPMVTTVGPENTMRSQIDKALKAGSGLLPSSAHWVETYADPCGRLSVYPGAALIPDGGIQQAAPARYAFAETIVPPWDKKGQISLDGKLYSMLVLQAPFFRSLAYVVVHRDSGEFTPAVMRSVQKALSGIASIADVTYPNWVGTDIVDLDGEPIVSVCSVAPSILVGLQPPSSMGVSNDIAQFRDVGRGITCYFNAPDLLNQGTVVSGQFNFNVSQHSETAQGPGEMVFITASAPPATGSRDLRIATSNETLFPGHSMQWATNNGPVNVATTRVMHNGVVIVDVGESWQWTISFVAGTTLALNVFNIDTNTAHPIGDGTNVPNYGVAIAAKVVLVGLDETKMAEIRFNGITLPPITQGDLAQQDPNNEIQLMKEGGGVYMPLRVFQPVYNVQNSAGFAPFAWLTSLDTIENIGITGYGDSYDRNFSIGVINMQSIPWAANPIIKAVNYREIVTTASSPMGAFLVRTGEMDETALEVARTLTSALPHAFPASYNGLGKLFRIVQRCLSNIPAMAANAKVIRDSVTQAISAGCEVSSLAMGRSHNPPKFAM